MTTEEKLSDAEQRITAQANAVARAEVAKEQAEAKLDETRDALKDEFGVSTSADIRAKREELETQLTQLLADIEAELEAAGA